MANVTGGQKAIQAIADLVRKAGADKLVRVGFLEKAKYPDGKPVAMIAAIQDFGAPAAGIPPRPFFRNMVADKKGEWPKATENLLKRNNYDVAKTARQVGEAIAGQLRQSIIDTNAPPLKPATIARKAGRKGTKIAKARGVLGPAKPLVDTGHLIRSIDYEVE